MSTKLASDATQTIKQVAQHLQVIERAIYRLVTATKIPTFKVGGTWRFPRTGIDTWIKQQPIDGLDAGRKADLAVNEKMNDGELA